MIAMNSSNNSHFWYLDLWNKHIPNFDFSKDELVIKAEPIRVSLWGSYGLRLPQNTWGVLCLPTGRMKALNPGFHSLNLLPGAYELFYVDNQQRALDLHGVSERAHDNWSIRMDVKFICQVMAPEKVVLVQQPLDQFTAACEAAIKNYIRGKPHDSLVPVSGEDTVDRSDTGADLRTAMNSSNSVEGFRVLKVIVLNITGDPTRLEVIDKANAQKTEIDQQNSLIEPRRKYEVESVRIDRLVAEERLEQQLRQAEIDAVVAEKLWKSKLQQVQLSLIKDNREIQIEKIRVMAKAFEALTEILMRYQMQGMTRNGDTTSLEAVARGMESLVNSLDHTSATNLLPEINSSQEASLMETLASEINKASELPYVEAVRLLKNGTNHIDAVVRLPGYEMTICCGDDYHNNGPDKVHVINDARNEYDLQEVKWNGNSKLSDVVNQFTSLLMAGQVKFNGHKSDSDSTSGIGHHEH